MPDRDANPDARHCPHAVTDEHSERSYKHAGDTANGHAGAAYGHAGSTYGHAAADEHASTADPPSEP